MPTLAIGINYSNTTSTEGGKASALKFGNCTSRLADAIFEADTGKKFSPSSAPP